GIDLESRGAALVAAARGQTQIAAGEAFGTVIFLFGVGFALALFLAKGPVESPSPLMVVAPSVPVAAAALAIAVERITRLEGGLLVFLYVCYVFAVFADGRWLEVRTDEVKREAAGGAGSAWL